LGINNPNPPPVAERQVAADICHFFDKQLDKIVCKECK
jgi:hypothetical protein